jgi:hypothetical protein
MLHFLNRSVVILFIALLYPPNLLADEPPENTLPVIAMRTNGIYSSFADIKLPLLCELSWLHFDGVEMEGPAEPLENREFMGLCGETGMLLVLNPTEITQYYNDWNPITSNWFRWTDYSLASSSCFGQLVHEEGEWSEPENTASASEMFSGEDYSITTTVVSQLSEYTFEYPALWFYNVYDESPARQWQHMKDTDSEWDDWSPNLYTQAWDPVPDPDVPALSEIEPAGIFSWQKHLAETNGTNPIPLTINFSLFHTIYSWEYTGFGGCNYSTMARQAISVRAFCEAMYQGPPAGGTTPMPVDNSPEFVCFDYYPFRYVDILYADSTTICDADWLFLIDHFEEGIDSTVIPAHEYGVPVFFYPQAFGSVGGPLIRDSVGNLDYGSYHGRTPTPQELLMLCNLGLLHQVKAIFPYSLASYLSSTTNPDSSTNFISSSLLDLHSIPFDAPYEDWVYTGRWPDTGDWEDKYEYTDPRELPPFSDGFDPLYELPSVPTLVPGDPQNREIWYTWFFEPYSRLYDSIGGTLAEIATVAPEMYDLWWGMDDDEPYWDVASIVVPDSEEHGCFVPPVIKIFQGDESNHAFLYYVNRYLREETLAVHVSIPGGQCPAPLSTHALDHSRRCLIPVDLGPVFTYSFDDTLGAGEGRLLEFVSLSPPIQADIRVTSPDVFAIREGSIVRTSQLRCMAGETIELGATFYNMGTSATGNKTVTFTDLSGAQPVVLETDRVNLSGLSGDYEPDSMSASILWETDNGDIGAHIVEISAATVQGEDALDNTVRVTVLVEPLDYATEVMNDPWDMTENGNQPWHTDDIVSVDLDWDEYAWTDSVSGMFEGVLEVPEGNVFQGDIILSEDSHDPIDADTYTMVSLAGVCNNPNANVPTNGCGFYVFWTDSHDQFHIFNLSNVVGGLGDGWDQWKIFAPFDMDSVSGWDGEIHDFGIRFQVGVPDLQAQVVYPIAIRLGWVKLEDGAL